MIKLDKNNNELFKNTLTEIKFFLKNLNNNYILYKKINILNNKLNNSILKEIIKNNFIIFNNSNKENILNIKNINKKIKKISKNIHLEFNNNTLKEIIINEHNLPNNNNFFFKNIIKNESKYFIKLNNLTYRYLMKYINNSNVREKLEYIFNKISNKNLSNIIDLLYYKNNYAKLFNYNTYTLFKLKNEQVDDINFIKKILSLLTKEFDDAYKENLNMLLKFKKKDNNSISNCNVINSFDLYYYMNMWKNKYINMNEVNKYFESNNTINNIINYFQQVFRVKFIKENNNKLWNETVHMFNIYDINNDNKIGSVYLDLFYYKNSEKKNNIFEIKNNVKNLNNISISCITMNSSQKYFSLDQVVLLFSYFGVLMNNLFSNNKFYKNCKFKKNVIGLIFKNIFWNQNIIKNISCHYDLKTKMPDKLIDKVINMKYMNNGIYYKSELLLSHFDLLFHDNPEFINICYKYKNKEIKINQIKEILIKLYSKINNQIYSDENMKVNKNLFIPNIINHIISNNSSLYHNNLLEELYAADIFCHLFQKNIFDTSKYNILKKYLFINEKNNKINDILFDITGKQLNIKSFIKIKLKNNDNIHNSIYNTPKTTLINDIKNNNIKEKCFTILSEESYSDDEFINTSNKFTEDILYNTINNDTISTVYSDDQHINQFSEEYLTENTETLKRYSNIFLKK